MASAFPSLRLLWPHSLLAALLALLSTGCVDRTSGPDAGWPAELSIRPVLAPGAGSFPLWVDHVRVQVIREPDEVLADTSVAVSPGEQELALELAVMITPPSEELLVRVQFLGSGHTLFQGETRVVVRPSPATNSTPEIPMIYVGPGAEAQSLTVEPGDSVLTFGDSLRLRVAAVDGGGNPIDPVFVSWFSSDPRLPVDTRGMVRAPSARFSAMVTARMPTGVQGTGILHVVPAPSELRCVPDCEGPAVWVGTPLPLTVQVLGPDGIGVPLVPVMFRVVEGGGAVAPATAYTDENGEAPTLATLGATPGIQLFEAEVAGLPPVTFSFQAVPRPAIQLTPNAVELQVSEISVEPVQAQVAVENVGGGNLQELAATVVYSGGGPVGWLGAVLSSQEAPATLTITATRGGLTAGEYKGRVLVSDPWASNSPQAVDVTFRVTEAPPHIELSQSVVNWEAGEGESLIPPVEVEITNSGAGTLSDLDVAVVVGTDQPEWLAATLSSSTAPSTLTLTPSGSLPAGVYTADVWVSSPVADNSPVAIQATLTVTPALPRIEVTPPSAAWVVETGGPTPDPQTLSVLNEGGGLLTGLEVTVVYPPNTPEWLAATLSSSTAPADLILSPVDALPGGTYSATVVVSSPVAENSPYSVPATMEVFSAPVIFSPYYQLLVLNDSETCSGQTPPGSLYQISFQYSDPDGDIPVSVSEGGTLYGNPIQMRYRFLPNGNSGSVNSNGEVDGNSFDGYASFEPCIQFGPAQNTSVLLTISLYDLGGHESNRISFTIARPGGANAPPPGAPGSVSGSGGGG